VSRSRLPPLNAIKAFEAAARLGSFTRAADELNVTHGAVSRQIRLLEDWLGVRLFLRTGRNAVPTQAGRSCSPRPALHLIGWPLCRGGCPP
jgi:LysR family transcriptional regulator, glycine cleavage system transcriptional activator